MCSYILFISSFIWTEYSCCYVFSIWSKRRRLVSFVRIQYLPVWRLPTLRSRVQICRRLEHTNSDFSLGWCVKFKNKWWSPLVSQFEQETSVSVIGHVLLNSQPFQLYFCNHILLPNCGNFFVQKILMGSYFVYICTFHVQNFMMGFSEIVYNTQPGVRLTI